MVEHLSADVVARVPEAFHFSGMVDYQHVLAVHAHTSNNNRMKRNRDDEQPNFEKGSRMDINQDDVMMLVPSLFSTKDVPEKLAEIEFGSLHAVGNLLEAVMIHHNQVVDSVNFLLNLYVITTSHHPNQVFELILIILITYCGRDPLGDRTDWVMHEYRLGDNLPQGASGSQGAFSLCRVVKRNEPGLRTGELQREFKSKRPANSSAAGSISTMYSNEHSNTSNMCSGDGYSSPVNSTYDTRRSSDLEPASHLSSPWVSPNPVLDTSKGRCGRAFLFSHAMNITVGPKEDRQLMTGLHTVADVYCCDCRAVLGWKYERAYEETQIYKEGKFILEK